jgi:hypothetical protein
MMTIVIEDNYGGDLNEKLKDLFEIYKQDEQVEVIQYVHINSMKMMRRLKLYRKNLSVQSLGVKMWKNTKHSVFLIHIVYGSVIETSYLMNKIGV